MKLGALIVVIDGRGGYGGDRSGLEECGAIGRFTGSRRPHCGE
jgi:hypothetical protein